MGLRIYQNVAALQGHYYLQVQEANFNKAIERLSSGLRINRGADDPAGLLISEKYRAQIDGLAQAINNAKDGIGMVQTAEGVLDEVTRVLRTMRNLALHASNTGPNDSEAIGADQAQIESEIATLDRIANTAQFGSKKLLDGSSGISGTTTDSDVTFISGTSSTTSGTYAVDITNAAVQGQIRSAAAKTVATVAGAAGSGAALVAESDLTFSGTLVGASPVVHTVTIANGADIDTLVADLAADTDLSALGFSFTKSGNNLVVNNSRLSGGGGGELTVTAETAEFHTSYGINDAGQASTTVAASASSTLRSNETLTFRNGAGTYVQVALTAGQAISSAVSQVQDALDDSGIKVTFDFDAGTQKFQATNQDYGSATYVANTFESSLAAAATNSGIAVAASTQYTIANASGIGGGNKTDGEDVAGTVGTHAATGEGVILTGDTGTPVAGLQLRIGGGVSGAQGSVTVTKNALEFQIGPFADQTVELAISDVRTNRLGTTATGITWMSTIDVANIDVTEGSGAGAQDAIRVLDAAISQVNTLRAQIGSFQKDVLESSVRNLGVTKQNMVSSESLIRDADMAIEMMEFSKAQILQQSAIAMLAQANTAPSLILTLFQ